MNTMKYAFASTAAAVILASAPVAFADSESGRTGFLGIRLGDVRSALRADLGSRFADHPRGEGAMRRDDNRALTGVVTAKNGTILTLEGKGGAAYTVETAGAAFLNGTLSDIAVGDKVVVKGEVEGTSVVATQVVDTSAIRERFAEARSHVSTGVVTAIDGSVITINPVGAKATTSIVTDVSTVFKARGEATTSSAISVGSKVFAIGTTTSTSTSTSGDTFVASMVKLIGDGFKHLRFWAWFR